MLALRTNAAGKPVDLARLTFNEGVIHVEFAGFLRDVIDARKRLAGAEKLIVSDADILGGEPVFKGTRVPVRHAAAALAAELRAASLNEVPLTLSRFFCRVRFGDELLSEAESLEIDSLLTRLEAALAARSPRGET